MEDACHAVERSKARDLPIAEDDVLTMAASWAGERARSKEGQRLWEVIGMITPQARADAIRDFAKEAGVVDCPLADALEAAVQADEVQRQMRLKEKLEKDSPGTGEPSPARGATEALSP